MNKHIEDNLADGLFWIIMLYIMLRLSCNDKACHEMLPHKSHYSVKRPCTEVGLTGSGAI